MAGLVATTGVLTVSAALAIGYAAVGAAAVEGQRVASVADAAALAAADAASGAVPGSPCERAAQVTEAAGVGLVECAVDELIATVAVRSGHGVYDIQVRARAGPPG